jgi:hypothetical protein
LKRKAILKRSLTYFFLIATYPLFASDSIAEADSFFAHRNENFNVQQLLADTSYINKAIIIYKKILISNADSLERGEAFWKLLQSYYFKGQFGTDDDDLKQEIYDEGIEIGEMYIDKLPESVAAYLWLGINWARWAEVSGIVAAAFKGVAGKVKYYAEKTIELDEYYLDAGGYRLLGMLHLSVPNIPLVLTWPSDEEGVLNLEKAYKIAPKNLYNKMYLALALHSNDQEERSKSLLLEVINTQEIVHDLAIDSFVKNEAQKYLNENF